MPTGKAVRMAMKVVRNVPDNRGKMPKCCCENKGVHCVSVKKSTIETSLKKLKDSDSSTHIIPSVVKMVISPLKARIPSMTFSPDFLKIIYK